MKLSPVGNNNIKFGYNKSLNRQLRDEISINPYSPANALISSINQQCNAMENKIVSYEGTVETDLDDNEDVVNLILGYFIPMKLYLCSLVDRFFPELHFSKTEADTYDNEMEQKEVSDFNQNARAYNWRNELYECIVRDLNNNQKTYNSLSRAQAMATTEETQKTTAREYVKSANSPMSLEDVVGLKNSIEDIEQMIILPLEDPEAAKENYENYGIETPSFVIFHGAPGCGKTMLAQAIANQTGCKMYSMSLAEVGSTYVNGTVEKIADAIDEIRNIAKTQQKPVILFLDEMDSVLSKREYENRSNSEDNKVVDTLLPILEHAKEDNILIIGATNMYNSIDPAVKRRAQLDCYIGLPNQDEIVQLMQNNLKNKNKAQEFLSNEDELKSTAKELIGYSPSNIINILNFALRKASKTKSQLGREHIKQAIKDSNFEKINENDYRPQNKKTTTQIGYKV